MITPSAEDFLLRLHEIAAGRKRIAAVDYRKVFAEMCPTLPPPDARTKLAGWLSLLAETDEILLPRGRRLYDRSGSGDLPAWVELARPEELHEPLPIDPEGFAWAPELRFACRVRDPRQLHILLRVQRFLAEGGRLRPLVPLKERSVDLFGKEKRLDVLRNSALFQPGLLSFELLRCFPLPPPLVWETAATGDLHRPVLVLENHSTYYSFAMWNRTRACYAAVVYGDGDAFKGSAAGLVEVVRSIPWDGRFYYFGDIDPEGLLIPLAASAVLATADLPTLAAHRACYRRLLNRATTVPLPSGEELDFHQESRNWLGDELAPDVEAYFRRGVRLPQELVGSEELAKDGASFAVV
jgi:hypothetical protein